MYIYIYIYTVYIIIYIYLVQTNITNSAEEKWALLTKIFRWKIAKLKMRTEIEEQFYTTLFHFIIT